MKFKLLLLSFLMAATYSWGQTTVFTDDFNRAAVSPGGTPSMTYNNTIAAGVTVSTNGSTNLRIANTTTSGVSYVYGTTSTFSAPYATTLSSNTGLVTWTFNFRWNRASSNNPAVPASGAYGQAIVLGASGSNFTSGTTGYAIVYGSASTPDPIRLVRFNGGVTGTLTNVISSGANDIANTNNYVSVRVTYDPSTNTWALFLRDDGTSSWADPSAGVTTQIGSNTVDNTYTGSALANFGFLWSHANSAGSTGDFDNYKVTVTPPCVPPGNPAGTISAGANPSCGPTSLTYSAPNANLYWQTSAAGTSLLNPTTSSYPVASSGTYYVRAYDGVSCWSTGAVSLAVTINTVPGTPTTGNPAAVCQGNSVSFTGTGSAGATSYTFWDLASGGTQYVTGGGYTVTATTLTTPSALAAGVYTYYVQGETATCSSAARKAVTVTINALPADPTGTISALANPSCGPATLNYSAPSATLYWQTTAGGTSTGNPTTSSYSAASTGTYYVRAYNGTCWSAGTVSLAVTVNTATAITSQPTNKFVVVGNTGTFSVTATGSSLSYQWQVSTDGGTTWSNVGANSNTYTTPATTFAMDGYFYQVIVSGGAPCTPVTSDAAELFVTNAPCLSANFDSSTSVPAGWSGSSSNDVVASHYSSGPNCRALTSGSDLITSATNNPIAINFNVDASGSGGQLGTLYYRVGVAAWTSIGTFTATTAGAVVSFDLTSAPNLSGLSNVSFRILSGANTIYIDDVNVYCGAPCTPATISSVTPASGPVGTEVTITASSGSLTGATATFNGVAATVVSSSATQLVVTVPSGATTGSLIVTDSQPCEATTAFTVITKDNTSCQGTAVAFTDLIISEVYDSQANNVWHMELYNPTAAPIDLATSVYKFERYANIGDASPTRTIALTGIVPAGGVFLADLGDTGVPCVKTWDFTSSAQGINALDEIRLTKNNVAVDVVYCPNEIGYTIKRKPTAAGPTATYSAADWDLLSAEDCTDLGLFPASVKNTSAITLQPSINVNCSTNAIVVSVTATEGFVGGNPLAYQWYVAPSGSATWTALSDGGVYSGTATANLNISSIAGLDGTQYYCQVRENTATCFIASNAVIIKGVSSTTWNGTSWSNGTPDLTKLAIINGNYDTAANGDFECCSLTINNTFTLDIKDTDYVVIQNHLTVNGTLEVQNQGSLVMISDAGVVTNNGTTNVRKMSSTFDRYDYTFWSSPITNALISVFSQWQTNYIFKLDATKFLDANNDSHDDNQDAWVFTPQAEAMSPGRAYGVMGKISQTYPAQQGVVFTGPVNNGVITQSIGMSLDPANANDDFNLVGNPYPSAISADAFITANTDISGTLYFWTHEGDIQVAAINPGPMAYNYSPDDFAYYNLAGGTGTRAGLLSGSGNSNVPTGFIASGQGFEVDASAATNVVFNNSMRNKNHLNTNFYRSASGATEKDRIWLNLTNPEGIFNQQLIGFFPGATPELDRGYDGYYVKSNTYAAFYSLIGDTQFKIQGREAYDVNSKVALGFRSAYEKTYTVSIGDIQGILRTENVYLEDKQLNIIHDLKASNYVFSTPAGEFNNRFVLRFNNETLGNTDFEANSNAVMVYANDALHVASSLEPIKEVVVYDVLGRVLAEKKNVNASATTLTSLNKTQSTLIVKVTLENGQIVDKKVIY